MSSTAYMREYRKRNREVLNFYKREWARRKRGTTPERYLLQTPKKIKTLDDLKKKAKAARLIKVYSFVFGIPEEAVAKIYPNMTRARDTTISKLINKVKWNGLPEPVKNHVFERDNFTCHYCGRKGIVPSKERRYSLVVDHKVSHNLYGNHHLDNLVTACNSCNSKKGQKSYFDYMYQLGYANIQIQKREVA